MKSCFERKAPIHLVWSAVLHVVTNVSKDFVKINWYKSSYKIKLLNYEEWLNLLFCITEFTRARYFTTNTFPSSNLYRKKFQNKKAVYLHQLIRVFQNFTIHLQIQYQELSKQH